MVLKSIVLFISNDDYMFELNYMLLMLGFWWVDRLVDVKLYMEKIFEFLELIFFKC